MDKRIRKLFVNTWGIPFVVAIFALSVFLCVLFFNTYYEDITGKNVPFFSLCKLFLMAISHAAITMIAAACFIASCMAGWRLARLGRQLPLRLLRSFLVFSMLCSLAGFLFTAFVKPALFLQQSALLYSIIQKAPDEPLASPDPAIIARTNNTYNLLALTRQKAELRQHIHTARQQLLAYACNANSKEEALNLFAMEGFRDAGLTPDDIEQYSSKHAAAKGPAQDTRTMDRMVQHIVSLQRTIHAAAILEWQYWLLPVQIIALCLAGFFCGALNRTRSVWMLFVLMIAFLVFVSRISGITAGKNAEDVPFWFPYVLITIMELGAAFTAFYIYKDVIRSTPRGKVVKINR